MKTTAAIVLAGGKSSRFGRDKASVLLAGRPLLQHVLGAVGAVASERIVVRAAGRVLPAVEADGVKVIEDLYAETGPLGGLCSGLASMTAEWAVAVACDMPLLAPALLSALIEMAEGYEAVVPLSEGRPQPLCAVYASTALTTLRGEVEAGRYRLADAVSKLRTRYVSPEEWRTYDADGLSFFNLNREEDLERAAALLSARR